MKKNKSSVLNLDANIVVLIAYLGGLIFKWLDTACYFAWAIPLIIYLIESKNKFVKRQSAQATLLYLVGSILSIIIYLLLIIFAPNENANIYNMIITGSLLLLGLISLLATIVAVTITIFAVVAIIKTYNYEDYNIPYLSKFLDKFIYYLEVLEGKHNKNKKEHSCKCNECHCKEKETKQETRIKVRPHKVRIKESIKETSKGRTRVQKIDKKD